VVRHRWRVEPATSEQRHAVAAAAELDLHLRAPGPGTRRSRGTVVSHVGDAGAQAPFARMRVVPERPVRGVAE